MGFFVSAIAAASLLGGGAVDRARTALHIQGSPWTETVLSGTANSNGLDGKYTFRFDGTGRFWRQVESQVGETYGFDGKTSWMADRSGAPHRLDFADIDRERFISMLLDSQWTDKNAPVELKEVEGGIELHLKGSLFTGKIELDSTTNLPTKATFEMNAGPAIIAFGDWKPAGNVQVPTKCAITEAGTSDVYTVNVLSPSKGTPASYTMPSWKPTNITFDSSKPVRVEARRAPTGHMMVHPLVNGQDVGWFILDSGADIMIIDPSVADSLKLDKIGTNPLLGVGGIVQSSFRPVKEFTLGQATLKDTLFAEFDLAQLSQLFGVKMSGIVGTDFFRRTIVSVDFASSVVTVDNPATYKLPGSKWVPLKFNNGNPAVQASFVGHSNLWFTFDTGANGTVSFDGPFVVKEHLLDGRKTTGASSTGAGGTVSARAGQIDWFELGGHRFDNPPVVFSEAKLGALANGYMAGNIGQDFMLPFNVVLDFNGARIAFIPKSAAH